MKNLESNKVLFYEIEAKYYKGQKVKTCDGIKTIDLRDGYNDELKDRVYMIEDRLKGNIGYSGFYLRGQIELIS